MRVQNAQSPSSGNSFGTLSDDGSHDLSSDGGYHEKRNRDRRDRRRRRKGDRRTRTERRGMEVTKMLTPVVKVLLFGVLLSFLDVLYILKQLEESSNIEPPNVSTSHAAQMPSAGAESINIKSSDNKKQEQSGNQNANKETNKNTDKVEANQQSGNKNVDSNNSNSDDPLKGREPIIKIIQDAGISFDPVNDADLIKELPLWSEVVEMYGPEPVIYGINEGNCERFQAQTDKGDHFIGTAGTFNTGTNLMSELLIANCFMPDHVKKYGQKSRGIRWQVPWGKHSPSGDKEFRTTHKTAKDKLVDANEIMPMVTIRDPLIWLKSMCRHKYTAKWAGFQEKDHCPNFLRHDLNMTVKYDGFRREYASVLHLWNDYYNDYKNIDIPILLVRFEDLVFHPEETVTKVCECGGGQRSSKKFRYIVDSAKKGDAAHGSKKLRTGFVDAMVRYGNLAKRYKDYHSTADLQYVRDHIDPGLMEITQYAAIDPFWGKSKIEVQDAKMEATLDPS